MEFAYGRCVAMIELTSGSFALDYKERCLAFEFDFSVDSIIFERPQPQCVVLKWRKALPRYGAWSRYVFDNYRMVFVRDVIRHENRIKLRFYFTDRKYNFNQITSVKLFLDWLNSHAPYWQLSYVNVLREPMTFTGMPFELSVDQGEIVGGSMRI